MPIPGGTIGAHDDGSHQGSAKRDVVDGVAGLDGSGFLLAKGAGIQFPRNGSDDVHIYERTSGEEAYAFHRTGPDDYTFYIKESNVWKRFMTESMKGVVNGIAGLDSNSHLDIFQMRPGVELYFNHNGVIDNYLTSGSSGNGVFTEDNTNHEFDLSTGISAIGKAYLYSKPTYTVTDKPLIASFLIQNLVAGSGGDRVMHIGFSSDFTDITPGESAVFYLDQNNSYRVRTSHSSSGSETTIGSFGNGDVLTVIVITGTAYFLKNGVIVATRTTNLPTSSLKAGACTITQSVAANPARQVSIDMINVQRYV